MAQNHPLAGLRTPNILHSPRALNPTTTKPKPVLEILPDFRFIVFHGGEHEAAPVTLTGRVRLTTPEPMSIMKPKVRLEGKRKVSWWYMGGMSAAEVVDKRVFWNQEVRLGIENAHKVKAGTIEWPFSFELSPTMPESVEGLRETYIVYHLHASVSRPGWNARDIQAQEHIRIVRTLGQESMEMTRSRVNADIWANKLSYSISIPTDAIVFGTSIVADVELSPIRKGITLGKVELRLMETVVKRIQMSEVPDARSDRTKMEESEVATADMDFPQDCRVVYTDETADDPVVADEMFKFKATLPLPKSLDACRQDVDGHSINVTHRFKLMVNIHNPEGHVSQLVCRLPVKLFISPNLPVDESNQVCPGANNVSDEELNSTETAVAPPPEYGRHHFDQMYSGIDPSGYLSRVPSGPNTPAGLFAQSRRGSHENLHALTGLTDGETPHHAHHGSAMPHLLRDRLADLEESARGRLFTHPSTTSQFSSGSNTPNHDISHTLDSRHEHHPPPFSASTSQHRPSPLVRTAPSYFAHQSPQDSASTSNRTSDDDHTTGIQQQDYNLADLSRVPSYAVAIRAPGTTTPFATGPPTYLEATSRPPSPHQTPLPDTHHAPSAHVARHPTPPRVPAAAHLQPTSPAPIPTLLQTSTLPLHTLPLSATLPQASDPLPIPHNSHDDEHRVRLLRAGS